MRVVENLVSVREFRRIKKAIGFVRLTGEGEGTQSHHFTVNGSYINSLPFKSVAQAKGFLKFEGFVMSDWEERGAFEEAKVIELTTS